MERERERERNDRKRIEEKSKVRCKIGHCGRGERRMEAKIRRKKLRQIESAAAFIAVSPSACMKHSKRQIWEVPSSLISTESHN